MSPTIYILCILAVALIALLVVAYHEEKAAKEAEARVKELKAKTRAARYENLRRLRVVKDSE